MKSTNLKTDILISIILITIGISTRLLIDLKPNFEFVTGIAIASGYFFHNKKLSALPVFLVMLITDIVIGNTIIFLFTWSAFAVSVLMGYKSVGAEQCSPPTRESDNANVGKLSAKAAILGGISTIIFFLWTNFGVVVTSTMYEKNIFGLIDSYIMGLPFLKTQLYGNLFLVPAIFLVITMVIQIQEILNEKDSRNKKIHYS